MIYRLEALDAFCDKCKRSFGEDDSEPATAPGGGFPTDMKKARALMKEYGWIRRGNQELVPSMRLRRRCFRAARSVGGTRQMNIDFRTKVPGMVCVCGQKLDGCSGPRMPKAEDVTICAYCGACLVFEADLSLRQR